MNLLTASVLILSGILALQVIFIGAQSQAAEGANIKLPEPEKTILTEKVITPQTTAESTETIYPEPAHTPTLRPYRINKEHDIWHAIDPVSYIDPDNEWVRYYASKLYIDYDGRLRYKNKPIALRVDTQGNVLEWTDEPFINTYVSDNDGFNYPPDEDMWVMPQYYLTHGMKDDCDGWMVTVTSIMQSGELSVKENSRFVKKVIPSKAVLGYMGGYRDGWTEYKAYGKTFLTTTALVNAGFNEKLSATEFIEKKDKATARAIFEFDSRNFGEYKMW